MIDPYLIIDIVVIAALTVLALAAFVKNTSIDLNRTFGLFSLCIVVWIITNYISNDIHFPAHTALIATYILFMFGLGAGIFLLRFCVTLAGDRRAKHVFSIAQFPLFLLALLSATPLVVKGVHVQGHLYAVEFGPLSTLYFILLPIVIIAAVYVVRRNMKIAHGAQKKRLQIILRSMYWTFPSLLLAQAVIPATTGWFGLTNIGVTPMVIPSIWFVLQRC